MNKKAVNVVITIMILLAAICVGYIIVNQGKAEPQKKAKEEEEVQQEPEIVQRQERSQNILLNSRVGGQLTDLIRYSNKYSSRLTEELDENGISNKFKILLSFDKIISREEYKDYIGYSEKYGNTYVLASNMKNAISNLFTEDQYTDENINGVLYYDQETKSYAMITTGVQGLVEKFVVEVPFKIFEYSDRIELYTYRVYVNQSVKEGSVTEGEEEKSNDVIVTDIYYNPERTDKALSFEGVGEFYESNQIEFLKKQLDDGKIYEAKLEQIKYTIKQDGNSFKFSGYEKIKMKY